MEAHSRVEKTHTVAVEALLGALGVNLELKRLIKEPWSSPYSKEGLSLV
jgi:hypothetical protein